MEYKKIRKRRRISL